MFGVRVARHGGPDVLEWVELADPIPGPTDVIINLTAAGLNFLDAYRPRRVVPDDPAVHPGF